MDYRSGLRNTDRHNLGHDRIKMDQDLPHFYTDSFSRDNPTNDASAENLDKMYFGRSVIAEPNGNIPNSYNFHALRLTIWQIDFFFLLILISRCGSIRIHSDPTWNHNQKNIHIGTIQTIVILSIIEL